MKLNQNKFQKCILVQPGAQKSLVSLSDQYNFNFDILAICFRYDYYWEKKILMNIEIKLVFNFKSDISYTINVICESLSR